MPVDNFSTVFCYKMGNEISKQQIDSNVKELDYSNKGIVSCNFEIPPHCQLQKLDLSMNRIESLPKGLKRLTQLMLSRNNMMEIPKDMGNCIMSYRNLEHLDLSYNNLSTIPEIFKSMPSLKKINLFGNKIKQIKCSKSMIQNIDLGNNSLTSFPELPSTILIVNLDHNNITSIESSYPNLSRLCISHNSITCVSPELVFPSLLLLDISHNELSNLPVISDVFPRIKTLDCSFNKIVTCPSISRTVCDMYFQKNFIRELPPNFGMLTFLTRADFSFNRINRVDEIPANLQHFLIFDNDISIINASNCPELSNVYVMHNKLLHIPLFSSNCLAECYLSFNQISVINMSNLCKTLTRIDLSHNEIVEVQEELFTLPSLTHLFLSHNKIETLPSIMATSSLIVMNASNNPIKAFPDNIPKTLEQLNLSNCLINSISESALFNQELIELDISNNNLETFPRNPHIRALILSRNRIKHFPDDLPSIEYLDLSCNLLESISKEISFIKLSFLDISHNKITKIGSLQGFPMLKNFKCQSNPLVSSIQFQGLPNLEMIDLSSTHIIIGSLPNDNVRVLTSEFGLINNKQYQLISSKSWISYSFKKGSQDLSEDYCFFNTYNIQQVNSIGLVLSEKMDEISLEFMYILFRKLLKITEIQVEKYADVFVKCEKKLKKKKYDSLPSFGILLFKEDRFIISSKGNVRMLVVSVQGDVNAVPCFDCEGNKNSHNTSHGIITDTDGNSGTYLVFGTSQDTYTSSCSICSKDRWIIITNTSIINTLTISIIGEICNNRKSARDICYDIRNMAYANTCLENLSIICLDLFEFKSN